MVEQAIEERGHGGGVAKQLAPVIDRAVRREQRGGPLVAPHDQFEEILGRGVRQLSHAEVIDDEQRHRTQFCEVLLARTGECGVSQLFEECVRFSIDDAVSLLNRRMTDRLREMTLARAGRSEKQHVLPLADEARRREVVDHGAIHLLVEIKVKGIERALGVSKACELVAALEQAVLATAEFIRHQGRHEVNGRQVVGLRLVQARLEDRRHAGQAELTKRAIEFDEVHCESPVVRSIRSR